MDVDKENLNKLTDDELFKTLKKYGITVGPITSTTRSIYEKKLRNYFDSMTNSQTANKTLASDKKGKEKELKEQKLKEQQQLKELQLKEQQLREQQLKEQQAKEQQLREQREHQLREQQLQEKLREQQLREEKLKEQLREQQLREQQLKEQQLREQQLREYREQQLREQQIREQQLREQQLREQQIKEQLLREQQLKEQQLREQQLMEQQLREQQLKEKQLRDQQAKEQQLREQQLKEQLREQQMREQQLKEKLREQQIKEQQMLKEQHIKEQQLLKEQQLKEEQQRKRREEELERERQKEIERELFERFESNKQAMQAKAKALETKGSNIPRLAEPTTSKLYPSLPTQQTYQADYPSTTKSTSSISITKTSDLNSRGGLLQNNEKSIPSSNHLKSMAISKESRNNDSNYQSMMNDTRSQYASQIAAGNLSPIRDKFAERLNSYGLYKGDNTTLYTSTLTSPTNIRSRPPLHQGADKPTLTSSNSISSTSEFNAATGSSSITKQLSTANNIINYKYMICVLVFTIIAYFFVMQFQNPENPI